MDKYQTLVEELLTIQPEEFPRIVRHRWSHDYDIDKGCLFSYCSPNNSYFTYNEDGSQESCGCLTQVKSGQEVAYTEKLTQLIRENPLIPANPEEIKQDRTVLEEFAKLQRLMDQTIRRETNGKS